jgi:hypothetical protein
VHIKAPNLLLQKYEKAQEKKKEKRKTKSPSPGHKNSHLFI